MSEEELKKQAIDMFTGNKEEILSNQLKRMDGWFDLSEGDIVLSGKIQELDKGRKYLSYLLAAYVANFIEKRKSSFVSHTDINEYFGWEDGRTSSEYVCDYSGLLNRERGEASIKISQMKEIIDIIEEKLKEE